MNASNLDERLAVPAGFVDFIVIYPIKNMKGLMKDEVLVTEKGLQHDSLAQLTDIASRNLDLTSEQEDILEKFKVEISRQDDPVHSKVPLYVITPSNTRLPFDNSRVYTCMREQTGRSLTIRPLEPSPIIYLGDTRRLATEGESLGKSMSKHKAHFYVSWKPEVYRNDAPDKLIKIGDLKLKIQERTDSGIVICEVLPGYSGIVRRDNPIVYIP